MSRKIRSQIAEETLTSLQHGFYINREGIKIDIKAAQQFAEDNTILYRPDDTDALLNKDLNEYPNFTTQFKVINDTTLNAVRQMIDQELENVLCLNFASAKNPGGGFLGGSSAQEESIARATGLYPTLLKCTEYYEVNRNTKTCFYTDYMIYSPEVPILKDEEGNPLHKLYKTSVITAPAVNTGVVKQRESELITNIEPVMKRRIEKVLQIALEHNHQHIVLGAWGCGVFGNNPDEIALYFKEVIDEKFIGKFTTIVFAIYSKEERMLQPFVKYFGQ